jgi:hypothetical protein
VIRNTAFKVPTCFVGAHISNPLNTFKNTYNSLILVGRPLYVCKPINWSPKIAGFMFSRRFVFFL